MISGCSDIRHILKTLTDTIITTDKRWSNPFCKQTEIPTNIKTLQQNLSFNVYPNPTTDFINIPKNANSIEIFNSIGQLENKFEYVNSRINIKDLFAGIYVINYTLDEHMYTGRFVKQ